MVSQSGELMHPGGVEERGNEEGEREDGAEEGKKVVGSKLLSCGCKGVPPPYLAWGKHCRTAILPTTLPRQGRS